MRRMILILIGVALAACASAPPDRALVEGGQAGLPHQVMSFENETLGRRWQVVSRSDTSFRYAIRYSYRVRVDGSLTEGQIRAISREVIRGSGPHNGMDIFFFLPDSRIEGHYTAGKADWWPNGRVADAMNIRTGDYSKHRLNVKIGSVFGSSPPEPVASSEVRTATRRKIFYEMAHLEDQGIDPEQTQQMVARKYRIDEAAAMEIAIEGAMRGWPMP